MATQQVRGEDWHCDAYGPEGGASCFFEEVGPPCGDPLLCTAVMDQERKRVWRVIQEGAAAGDSDMVAMAEYISGPDELLGGSDK